MFLKKRALNVDKINKKNAKKDQLLLLCLIALQQIIK